MTTATPRLITLSRLLLSLAVAFLLGAMLTPRVDATRAQGSVGSRVSNQRDLCAIDGGTFSSTKSGKITTTSCTGGSQGDWSCDNSKHYADCQWARLQSPPSPLDGIVAPPPGGVSDGPTGNTGDPVLLATPGSTPDHHHGHQRHGHRG